MRFINFAAWLVHHLPTFDRLYCCGHQRIESEWLIQ